MKEDMKNFETALSELEALVRKLESDVAIDEATKAFAEGIRLSKIWMEELKAETPIGRNGTPEDVAQAIAYLADAPFVTGQILAVNGGLVL